MKNPKNQPSNTHRSVRRDDFNPNIYYFFSKELWDELQGNVSSKYGVAGIYEFDETFPSGVPVTEKIYFTQLSGLVRRVLGKRNPFKLDLMRRVFRFLPEEEYYLYSGKVDELVKRGAKRDEMVELTKVAMPWYQAIKLQMRFFNRDDRPGLFESAIQREQRLAREDEERKAEAKLKARLAKIEAKFKPAAAASSREMTLATAKKIVAQDWASDPRLAEAKRVVGAVLESAKNGKPAATATTKAVTTNRKSALDSAGNGTIEGVYDRLPEKVKEGLQVLKADLEKFAARSAAAKKAAATRKRNSAKKAAVAA